MSAPPGSGPGAAVWVAAALVALALAVVVAPGPVAPSRRAAAGAPDRDPGPGEGRRPPPAARLPVLAGCAVALSAAALGGVGGIPVGLVLGVASGVVLARRRQRSARPDADPLAAAGAWDQLAACLRAGLPLEGATRAVVPLLPPAPGAALTHVADLAALGADPVAAWEPALEEPTTRRLARAARRSARTGSAVADVAEAVAADVRAEAADAVAARAERAAVLVTGPLGLCFLPAFVALGIVPVVLGLAGPLLEQR